MSSEQQFYINFGRWADYVVGPFPTRDEAERYIGLTSWRGMAPSVVSIEPPDTDKLAKVRKEYATKMWQGSDGVWRVEYDGRGGATCYVTREAALDDFTRGRSRP